MIQKIIIQNVSAFYNVHCKTCLFSAGTLHWIAERQKKWHSMSWRLWVQYLKIKTIWYHSSLFTIIKKPFAVLCYACDFAGTACPIPTHFYCVVKSKIRNNLKTFASMPPKSKCLVFQTHYTSYVFYNVHCHTFPFSVGAFHLIAERQKRGLYSFMSSIFKDLNQFYIIHLYSPKTAAVKYNATE